MRSKPPDRRPLEGRPKGRQDCATSTMPNRRPERVRPDGRGDNTQTPAARLRPPQEPPQGLRPSMVPQRASKTGTPRAAARTVVPPNAICMRPRRIIMGHRATTDRGHEALERWRISSPTRMRVLGTLTTTAAIVLGTQTTPTTRTKNHHPRIAATRRCLGGTQLRGWQLVRKR